MASLDVALNTVSQLEALSLPDEQPNIEAAPLSIVYDVSFDTNFEDRTAFITGVARYNEEATVQAGLVWGGGKTRARFFLARNDRFLR